MGVYQATLLLILLIFLSVSYTSNSSPRNDDNDDGVTWSLNCRRCKFYVRAGVGGAPVAPPDTSSSGKKPNIGIIVGLTFLLVFILVGAFVCVYRMKRSENHEVARKARVLVPPGVVREEIPPQQRVVRAGIQRDEKREGQKQGDDDKELGRIARQVPRRNGIEGVQPPRNVGVAEPKKRGGEGNVILPPPPPPWNLEVAEENKRDEQRKQQRRPQDVGVDEQMERRRKGKQQVPPPPPPPPQLPPRDIGVDEQMERRRKGKQQVPPPPPPPPRLPPRDVGVDEQMERRRKGKQQVPPPPPPPPRFPPRDVGVDEQMERRRKGKQQVPPPPPPPPPPRRLPTRDVRVDEQMKGGRKGKEQVPLPLPPPPRPPLDGNVGRMYDKDNVVGVQHGIGGVEGNGQRVRERAKIRDGKRPKEAENSLGLPNKFSYNYIKAVTNNFDPNLKIGGGGYGIVYLGTLYDGTMVAVKSLKYGGRIDDFKNEVEALVRADHPNLVKLIGYCDDSITRFLVYEYMRNSSLDTWIFRAHPGKTLSWPEMKNIIQGIAQGLVYLHEKRDKTTLHRDLKPHNVLLDDNKNAKLCDFGLAKLINKDQSGTLTTCAGTPGYMAPEVLKHKKITEKIDVYSFGVLVLEVMFGKRFLQLVSSDGNTGTEEIKLPDLIRKLSGEMQRNGREIYRMGKLAVLCLRTKPEERPSMSVMLASLQSLNRRSN